jgi:cytochrome P450
MQKLFNPAFSKRALRKQQPLFQGYTDRLIAKLRAQAGAKVNLVHIFNFTAFDIMSELAFRQSLKILEQNEYCP